MRQRHAHECSDPTHPGKAQQTRSIGYAPKPRSRAARALRRLLLRSDGQGIQVIAPRLDQSQWKEEKLNKSVQLTISGCLGPCDLANVICVISPQGIQWLGGLQEQWQYGLLLDWAKASRDAGVLLELPAELNHHRFERFAVSEPSEESVGIQSPIPGRRCQEVSHEQQTHQPTTLYGRCSECSAGK